MSCLIKIGYRALKTKRVYYLAIKRSKSVAAKPPKSCNVRSEIPTITLNSGYKIPVIGLGTWQSSDDLVKNAVIEAVKVGYRMIDTAYVYGNEKSIGAAIKELLEKKVIESRQELFITSKLWNTFHRPDLVENAIRLSLDQLQLNYLDLYLMHWPTAYHEGNILYPRNACGLIKFSNVDYIDTWRAMEQLQQRGLTKSIGISNFNKSQIERLLQTAKICPAMLQVECHPFLNQKKLMAYCREKNIAFTASSPLGSSTARPYAVKGEERLMENNNLERIAFHYKKSPAQILIRYQIQRGNIVIPKSSAKARIESNFQVFDWQLTDAHIHELDSMNTNIRYVMKLEEFGKHKYYPFRDEC